MQEAYTDVFTGRQKLVFARRLENNWQDLADYFDIPASGTALRQAVSRRVSGNGLNRVNASRSCSMHCAISTVQTSWSKFLPRQQCPSLLLG